MSLRAAAVSLLALTACVERPLDAEASATAANTTSTGTTGGEPPATATLPETVTTAATVDPTGGLSSGPTGDSDGFIAPPDLGSDGVLECDPFQRICPEGQKCMPYSGDGDGAWESWGCFDLVPDPAGLDEPCVVLGSAVSGEDTCADGLQCWNVDEDTLAGTCLAMCTGTADAVTCADPWASCLIAADAALLLCIPMCDPIAQDCPGDDLCIPDPHDPGRWICVLDPGDEGGAFDPCEYVNACDKGLVCLNPEFGMECDLLASGCCLPLCDLDLPNTCPGQGQVCISWYDPGPAPPGYENVGACGLP